MSIRSLLLLWAAVAGLGSAVLAQELVEETPSEAFEKAYLATRKGDLAYETKQWDSAIQQYQAGLKALERIQTTWPGWFPDRVQARIAHCRFQILHSAPSTKVTVSAAAPAPAKINPAPVVIPPKAPPVAPAPATPRDLYDQAYQLAHAADQALAIGDKSGAAKQYNSAVKILRDLRFEFPNWQPEVVDVRLSHCLLQLRKTK